MTTSENPGGKASSRAAVDANGSIERILSFLERALDRSVRLRPRLAAERLAVPIEPGRLERALLNLFLNALEAMPEGGTISVCSARVEGAAPLGWERELDPGPQVRIEISDSGEGMELSVLERAFERFFTTRGGGHAGLGLSTSRELIESAGGLIALESSPGSGTVARIVLPEAAGPGAGAEGPGAA